MADDYDVVWNGTLYRQDEQRYSLLGLGWQVRQTMLQATAPARGAYPSKREVDKANLVLADDIWRGYRPAGSPHCLTCGRPTLQRKRYCTVCAGKRRYQQKMGQAA